MALSPLLAGYDRLLLDLDGCVWVGDRPTPGAPEAIAECRRAGLRVAFVTNDARGSTEDLVRKLWGMGLMASLEEVVTVGGAIQHHLAEAFPSARAVVVGSAAVHRHVMAAGLRTVSGDEAEQADVVVVAAHEDFHYAELRDATRAVLAGAALIGAGRDPTFPMPDGPSPGTGALLAAVETATGVGAHVLGKPEAGLIATAQDRLGPGRYLMVGDRIDADLAGAIAGGIDGAIVLTGASTRSEAEGATPPPVAIADDLASMLLAR